jgi:hypothetical protein
VRLMRRTLRPVDNGGRITRPPRALELKFQGHRPVHRRMKHCRVQRHVNISKPIERRVIAPEVKVLAEDRRDVWMQFLSFILRLTRIEGRDATAILGVDDVLRPRLRFSL